MSYRIRIWLDRDLVNKETILNLHRFGNDISQSIKKNRMPTDEQIALCALLNQPPIFEMVPAYPLGPDGTVTEMLEGKLDPPNEKSYDFFVKFRATCTKEEKDSIILQILGCSLVERLQDGYI